VKVKHAPQDTVYVILKSVLTGNFMPVTKQQNAKKRKGRENTEVHVYELK